MMESNTGQVMDMGSRYHRLEGLKDKCKAKGKRYALVTILMGMFPAKLCGEDKPIGIAEGVALRGTWIAHVLGLKRKSMSSHHTYRRALARDHQQQCGRAGYQAVVAMDREILRGTIDLETNDGLFLLAQIAIQEKHSDVSAAPTPLS